MGIYIKGMKMPKTCGECPCHELSDLFVIHDVCKVLNENFNDDIRFGVTQQIDTDKERLPNCPLVELPPHGRLIDVDEIDIERSNYDTYADYSKAFDTIDAAPTIIEAEE